MITNIIIPLRAGAASFKRLLGGWRAALPFTILSQPHHALRERHTSSRAECDKGDSVHQPKRLADPIDAGDDSDHEGDKGGDELACGGSGSSHEGLGR